MSQNKYLHIVSIILLATTLYGQSSGKLQIDRIGVDDQGHLLVQDKEMQYYRLGRQKLNKAASSQSYNSPSYELNNSRIRKYTGTSYSYIDLPFAATGWALSGEDLIISSLEGLWVFQNGQPRKLYVPGVTLPSSIIEVSASDDLIAIITDDYSLSVYNKRLQSHQYISASVTQVAIDKWNTIWYLLGGELRYDNKYINSLPPDIITEGVTYNGEKVAQIPMSIESDDVVSIDYRFDYPPLYNDVEGFYTLDGGSTWSKIESNGYVNIEPIKQGGVELQIKALGLNGADTITPPHKIKVNKSQSSGIWYWSFGGIAFLLAISMLGLWRVRREMKDIQAQKKRIENQLLLEKEKQKLGQLQMNPHFLFNTLNSIRGMIAIGKSAEARQGLLLYANMMRSVLDASIDDKIKVAEEKAFLSDYLKLESMIRECQITYTMDIDEALLDYDIPQMMIQPFVENGIIHGISSKESGHITIMLKPSDKGILVSISDNGVGRQSSVKKKRTRHRSAAIDIIKDRLNLLNKWQSKTLTYNDLKDSEGLPLGTEVSFYLPKL